MNESSFFGIGSPANFEPVGSPTAEQHALRSLQNLLRIDPGAFHEFVDPQSPTSSALSTAVRGNKMDAVTVNSKPIMFSLSFFCGGFFRNLSGRVVAN